MTREELKEHCKKTVEQCEMWAISRGEEPSGKVYEEHKAILDILEQEPCEDAISREDVIKLVECSGYDLQFRTDNADMCDDVRKLSSVTPKPIECNDVIRREALIELNRQFEEITNGGNITKESEALRYAISVLEQKPIKYWIDYNGHVTSIQQPCEDVINRLDKIRQIIAIPNSVIQEDVIKYKMICEVINDDKSVS